MGLRLNLSGISKSYNGNIVLNNSSYLFEKGRVYVLMGPNGCGKSTLLRIAALLENPDSGSVNYIEGDSVLQNDISLKRRMTLVLPKIGVFNTTVLKNVAYGLRIRGFNKKELSDRASAALEAAGLIHKKNDNALTLSSGETQRLGIARAMVIKPDMLFLDEPTASIDSKNTALIEDIINRMKMEGSITVLMTTHDHNQAKRLTDRILGMDNGSISE
ncbi:MAG: ATP-binding cassette domain-containing protein [Nitrospirota bacterium]